MGLKAYIPGTAARRDRLYGMALQKRLGGAEVLMQVEWPDGTESLKPANYDADIGAWVTEDGMRWFSKGKGGNANNLMGVPIIHVDAENAGVVSAEAAKFAQREEDLDYVDEDGNQLEVVSTDEEGEPKTVSYPDSDSEQRIAADGGEIELHYKMGRDGYDGEVINRRKAGLYDPFPVSRKEADQAIEHAIGVGRETGQRIKDLLIGVAVGVGIPILLIILVWLLGQIGGGGGGGGSAIPLMAMGVGL